MNVVLVNCFFFFKQKTAYEMRISDWSSDVCSSDLLGRHREHDVEVADREKVGLAGLEPGARGGALASWTVPVAAAVIGDPPVPAVGTGLDVTAERGGSAMLHRRHDLELWKSTEEVRVGETVVSTCRAGGGPTQ